MKIGFIKEGNDTRVSLTPEVAKKFKKSGHDLFLESGAGDLSNFKNFDYKEFANVLSYSDLVKKSDILISINPIKLNKINSDFSNKIYLT